MKYQYTRSDIVTSLREAGLCAGDNVFLTTSLGMIGFLEGAEEADDLNGAFLDAVRTVLGETGTVFVPTYSYTFGRGTASSPAVFDPETTPAEIGPFPEFFRKQPAVVRSHDPMMSIAGLGPLAARILHDIPNTSYGHGCVFAKLLDVPCKCVSIGLGPNWMPFIHHADWLCKVPFRFDKLFQGLIKRGDRLDKLTWIYNVRTNHSSSRANAHEVAKRAVASNLWKWAKLGRARIYVADYLEYFNFDIQQLRQDPWITAVGPPGDVVQMEEERLGAPCPEPVLPAKATIREMADALYALPRNLLSSGYDAALSSLNKQLPMTIHEYPSGTECFTWIVPEKWTCHEAALYDLDGKEVFSYKDHPLHVMSYSLSFDQEVSRKTLFKHLYTHPTLPEAIPFKFKYYERDWGLCCTQKQKESLTKGQYRVSIKTDFSYNTLKVGEAVAKGTSTASIILCAHLCHPGQFNDDLSGVLAGIEVMRRLQKRNDLRYTYRLLILPETIGSAAWLSHNEALIPDIRAGLFLEMLGTKHPHSLQASLDKDSLIDRACRVALHNAGKAFNDEAFAKVILNDERMFNSVGVNIPMASLSRALLPGQGDFPYREYHTSLDTPENADFNHLRESVDLVLDIVDIIEKNNTIVPLYKGELFCARYSRIEYARMWPLIHSVPYLMNGERDLIDLALLTGRNFNELYEFIQALRDEGLVSR
jgi:aminopeptidase-like protein/aminoglycoside N3'-acetyltransferase